MARPSGQFNSLILSILKESVGSPTPLLVSSFRTFLPTIRNNIKTHLFPESIWPAGIPGDAQGTIDWAGGALFLIYS
jgi:hypothetical protein